MRFVILALAALFFYSGDSVADEKSPTLKRISAAGQINIGYRKSNPPMSFEDPSGKPIGYSIDLCGHVVSAVKEKLGRSDLKVSYVPVSSTDRFSAIEKGKIDLLCGATTKTYARSERVGFSLLTFVTGASLLSPDGKKVDGIAGLAGRRVAVSAGTSTEASLKEALKAKNIRAEIVTVKTGEEGMDKLDGGAVDAFSADQVVLIGQVIARQKKGTYFLSSELFSYEPLALAFTRGDADFQQVVDQALSKTSKSREIESIYQKWMGRFGQKPPVMLKALYRLNQIP